MQMPEKIYHLGFMGISGEGTAQGPGKRSPEVLLPVLPATVAIRIVICCGSVRIEPETIRGFDRWDSPDSSGVPEIVAENDQSIIPLFQQISFETMGSFCTPVVVRVRPGGEFSDEAAVEPR